MAPFLSGIVATTGRQVRPAPLPHHADGSISRMAVRAVSPDWNIAVGFSCAAPHHNPPVLRTKNGDDPIACARRHGNGASSVSSSSDPRKNACPIGRKEIKKGNLPHTQEVPQPPTTNDARCNPQTLTRLMTQTWCRGLIGAAAVTAHTMPYLSASPRQPNRPMGIGCSRCRADARVSSARECLALRPTASAVCTRDTPGIGI